MYEENDEILIKGDRLRFIHFSGYGASTEKCMREWLPEGEHPFRDLYRAYAQKHEENNRDGISKTKWSYGFFASGEKIKDAVRLKYRSSYELMYLCENPFEKSNQFYKNQKNGSALNASKAGQYMRRAGEIYRQEGFRQLCKKIKNKMQGHI